MLLHHFAFKRYWGVQFLGAFNDNLFKNGFILFLSFSTLNLDQTTSSLLINLSAAVFILPFFLFSAHAGHLADRTEASVLIRRIKALEVLIMLLAGIGFYLQQVQWLVVILFLMGVQSSYFGPVKYSILPRMLADKALLSANAWVEGGTFIAILSGMLVSGWLIELSLSMLYGLILSCALLGYGLACRIPVIGFKHPADPQRFKLWQSFKALWRVAHSQPQLPMALLGISWFWFLGASYLTQLPNFVRYELGGDSRMYLLFLSAFSLSVALGAGLGVSLRRWLGVQIGVALGLLGLLLSGSLWMWMHRYSDLSVSASVLMVMALGVSGGLYAVPLYTYIQRHSADALRSRVIAANNVLNALFMVASAALAMTLLGNGWDLPALLSVIAALNLPVAVLIYWRAPQLLRHLD